MKRNQTPLDELAILLKNPPHNLFVNVYNKDNKIKKESSVKKSKAKYTLNQLGETVDKLGSRVDQLGNTVDKLSKKVDQIGDALFEFINTTNKRFDNIEKRIDNIEKRLDYNGLKKLPISEQ